MSDEQALARDARKRAILVGLIAGLALVALGIALVYMGMTFEEPAERLATRSVPKAAPIALSIGGVVVALAGVALMVQGMRRGRR